MNSNRLVVYVALLGVLFSVACRSKKIVNTKPAAKPEIASEPSTQEKTFANIDANTNKFSFYQSRAKANYKDDKQNVSFDVNLVMEKDQYIWMSITAVLGIEVARVYITQDSVKILDRLHRKYIAADFGYIQRLSNVPLKLANLQNLIVGNTLFYNSVQKSVVDTILSNLAIYTYLNTQKQTTYYSNNFKVLRGSVAEQNQSREMRYDYPSFSNFGSNQYPNHININIRAEKNIECTFELSNFVFDKKREIQFTVPSGYEVVKP